MKKILSHAAAKITGFFWSRGFLKFALVTITLVILFYVEEDWRGARNWAATKAFWEAKGETFDYNKFIPPPIPDDQNLAALPLFKVEQVEWTKGRFNPEQVTLKRAMRTAPPGNDLPLRARGNWQKGELPDMGKIQAAIAANYAAAFKGVKPPEGALAQFNALYPFVQDLLADGASRPLCRLNVDYAIYPPFNRGLSSITNPINLSKILALHAVLALDQHQPDLALEDIKTNYKLLSGAGKDPSLVGGLVAIGVMAITQGSIYDGLAFHSWNDAQLVELESALRSVDFLAAYQFTMRSEAGEGVLNIDCVKNTPRYQTLALEGGMSDSAINPLIYISLLWPGGWWDENKSQLASSLVRQVTTVNPSAHVVYAKASLDLNREVERAKARWDAGAPWNFWSTMALGSLTGTLSKFANAQAQIDEARIACALERYHLAHGVYPDRLDALVPAYADALPNDIITSLPYLYQLHPDGSFILYSVGWNEKDDGGRIVYKKDAPTSIDYKEGDWVWPGPRASK